MEQKDGQEGGGEGVEGMEAVFNRHRGRQACRRLLVCLFGG